MNLSELENKYVLVSLYGVNRTNRPVSAENLHPMLCKEWGDNASSREAELNAFIREIVVFGKQASELSGKGFDRDSLEYDDLKEKAKGHSEIALQFALQCYSNGSLPSAALDLIPDEAAPENSAPESGEAAEDKAAGDAESAENLPEADKETGLTTESLLQSIMNDSGAETDENADSDWVDIRKNLLEFRTWTNDLEKVRELNSMVKELENNNSPHHQEARDILENGKKLCGLFSKAFKVQDEKDLVPLRKEAVALQATEKELRKLNRQFRIGKEKRLNWIKNRKNGPISIQPPDYDLAGSNPHFIGNLAPCPEWTIMVDESGSIFTDQMFKEKFKKQERGHFVALLIPKGSTLPALGDFHSVEANPKDVAGSLDNLLHTPAPCGIIGITLDGMANVNVDYWYNGLERLFDLILRLLPMEGDKTKLDIYVEARGSSTQMMVQRSFDSSLYRLAKVDQGRALKFDPQVAVIEKNHSDSALFSAWNGYVDAVAYSWCCSSKDLKNILFQYGLIGACLMEGTSQNLYEVMDDLKNGRLPKPEYWSELLLLPAVSSPDSLVARLLAEIGDILRHSSAEWVNYLNHLVRHLDSKAINLWTLGKQINYLKKYQPDDSALPPRLQLLWLTAKLAEANHRGGVVVEAFDKFKGLIRDLYEEDAPLTCYATLHLAVTYTNAYRFQDAQNIVEDYLRLISDATWGKTLPNWVHSVFDMLMTAAHIEPASPAAIPGLRYFAQLISSHGQHEAFFGRNAEAVKFFAEANRLFAKLSDRDEAVREQSQTTAYLLTALMDLDSPDPAFMESTLKSYFGDDLDAAARRLAVSNAPADKYSLHILLRYILSGKAPDSLKSAVLEQKAGWKTSHGHPWEMIEFYRGLLLDDPAERMAHLQKARELCAGNDATLHVIEAVILGTILLEDDSVLPKYRALVAHCALELPYLGSARVAALQEQPQKRLPALELAKIVLPFNFR